MDVKEIVREAPKPRGRIPRLKDTRSLEREYESMLTGMLNRLKTAVRVSLLSELNEIDEELENQRMDADPADLIVQLLARTRFSFGTLLSEQLIRRSLEAFAGKVNKQNQNSIRDMFKETLGISLPIDNDIIASQVKLFTEENIGLIQNLKADLLKDIEQTIMQGVRTGQRPEQLYKEILGRASKDKKFKGRFKKAETRAKLIARDQVLKFNSSLTEARYQEAGIEKYKWVTSNDERVRDEHKRVNGQIFRWDTKRNDKMAKPSQNGIYHNPGEAPQCRCVAFPVFE